MHAGSSSTPVKTRRMIQTRCACIAVTRLAVQSIVCEAENRSVPVSRRSCQPAARIEPILIDRSPCGVSMHATSIRCWISAMHSTVVHVRRWLAASHPQLSSIAARAAIRPTTDRLHGTDWPSPQNNGLAAAQATRSSSARLRDSLAWAKLSVDLPAFDRSVMAHYAAASTAIIDTAIVFYCSDDVCGPVQTPVGRCARLAADRRRRVTCPSPEVAHRGSWSVACDAPLCVQLHRRRIALPEPCRRL